MPCPCSSASSGARRSSPASLRAAPSGWPGTRASPEPLDRSQARPHRPGNHGHYGTAQPDDQLVGKPVLSGRCEGRADSLSINKIAPPLFGASGIAPLGYAAFAFALGVTAGVLIRRTLPAMAVTLVIFAAVQILMPMLIQPHLIPPAQATAPFNANVANEIDDQAWQQHDGGGELRARLAPGSCRTRRSLHPARCSPDLPPAHALATRLLPSSATTG